MKVSGFTFVKNAIIYDYPIVEAIQSILPLCDEVVVAVGKSDDDTRNLIASINPEKIRIIDTEWDESLREGGRVLALETDKAFQAIAKDADWAFYIQGDEVIHEKYHETIRQTMKKNVSNLRVDGLLFSYKHFYGNYDYVGAPTSWYANEIRIVRNNPAIFSYKDAQGFRKGSNEKLQVVPVDAAVHHYGWVKKPEAMQKKQENFNRYWHDDQWVESNVKKGEIYDYMDGLKALQKFEGTHPAVMKNRIETQNWDFKYDPKKNALTLKDKFKGILNKLGFDPNYTNYKVIKV